jgi:hypothetical protein
MGGACSTHGTDEKFIQQSSRKSEEKSPLGRFGTLHFYCHLNGTKGEYLAH